MIHTDESRAARAALTYLADPADPLLGALLRVLEPGEVIAAIRSGTMPAATAAQLGQDLAGRLRPVLPRWRAQLAAIPPGAGPGAHEAAGIHLVCPGDPGWPARLDDLGSARPCALWVRGSAGLDAICHRSVAVVGARAATAYGMHVCAEISAGLGAGGWAIVSGGALGIDTAAHRAALASDRPGVAVLACGPDVPYPPEHAGLLDAIAASGAVISEYPPGTLPARHRFLARNRLVAALPAGTVVIEAALRSGTMATARQALSLGRPLMAVPGPVTSAMSAGCHGLIRDQHARLVTSPADVLTCMPSTLA